MWLQRAIEHTKLTNVALHDRCGANLIPHPYRRRLWWSCVIRDRLLALVLRQPLLITPDPFSFGQCDLFPVHFESVSNGTTAFPSQYQYTLAFWSSEICHLVKIMTHLLMIRQDPSSLQRPNTGLKRPVDLVHRLVLIPLIQEELHEWMSSLSKRASNLPECPTGLLRQAVMMHRNLICIYWQYALPTPHTARCATQLINDYYSASKITVFNTATMLLLQLHQNAKGSKLEWKFHLVKSNLENSFSSLRHLFQRSVQADVMRHMPNSV